MVCRRRTIKRHRRGQDGRLQPERSEESSVRPVSSLTPTATASRTLTLAPSCALIGGTDGHSNRLNWAARRTGATLWGPLGAGPRRGTGLRGPRASLLLFAVVWPLECVGLVRARIATPPSEWTPQELAVDVGHKVVLALVSAAIHDRP